MTAPANASVSAVHTRMPVVLRPEEVEAWLSDSGFALGRLAEQPLLTSEFADSVRQLTLF